MHELSNTPENSDFTNDISDETEITVPEDSPEIPKELETQEACADQETAAIQSPKAKKRFNGVSVITATNKPEYMKRLFMNFKRQHWKEKELIVLLNNDRMNIEKYRKYARRFGKVSIYQMSSKSSLGKCLNYGISKAKYEIIAKFDDDDFYSSHYLTEAMMGLERTKADVIGKNKFYMYFSSSALLMQANMPGSRLVAGATIVFRKKLYPGVSFSNLRKGSDMRFLKDCMAKGYKIRSTSRYNFTAIRRQDQKKHTWKVTARTFRILRAKTVARTRRFREIVIKAISHN